MLVGLIEGEITAKQQAVSRRAFAMVKSDILELRALRREREELENRITMMNDMYMLEVNSKRDLCRASSEKSEILELRALRREREELQNRITMMNDMYMLEVNSKRDLCRASSESALSRRNACFQSVASSIVAGGGEARKAAAVVEEPWAGGHPVKRPAAPPLPTLLSAMGEGQHARPPPEQLEAHWQPGCPAQARRRVRQPVTSSLSRMV
jgi:hypothetical protein